MTSVRMALLAVAAAAALSRRDPDVWNNDISPGNLPPHRQGNFKPNARKASKNRGKGSSQ